MKIKLVLSVIFLVGHLSRPCWASENIQSRFDNSLRNIKSIANVQIDWQDTLSVQDPAVLELIKSKTYVRTFQYSYVASGQKYRATCKLISGTQTNIGELLVSSFDGKSYATYSGNQHYMTTQSHDTLGKGDNAQSAMNPLIAPFMFLTKWSEQCKLCMMRFVDVDSDSFTNGLVLPTAKKTEGLIKFSMPGVPWNNQPTTWTIVMNEAGDSFTPEMITFTVPGLHYETITRLLNYTNLGAYEFPSKIEWITSSYPTTVPPTTLSTGSVILMSARMPDNITDSAFGHDEEKKLATTIWDWNTNTFTRISPALTNANARTGTVRYALLAILFITAVVPIVVVVAKKLTAKSR